MCLALGKTKGELLSSMSSQEINEWMAYDKISPFGQEREDAQLAVIASTIANVNRPKGKKAFTINDFILFKNEKKEPETLLDKMKRMNATLGGKVVIKDR